MKKIVLSLMMILGVFNANAQTLIGTKENLKPYKQYLKTPDFLELLEKSKQPVKNDSTEIITFNGFSEGKYLKWEFLQCSFDVEKFRTRTYRDEYGLNEYIELASHTYYIYQNQKIVYKSISIKKDLKEKAIDIKYYNRDEEVIEIFYYQNGKPKQLYSKLAKTNWFFDKKGNIAKVSYDELGNRLILFDLEEKKKFVLDNSKFTLKEHLKIREDFLKMLQNTSFQGNGFDNFTVNDWKALNKTKKYFKKLFKTDVDLYLDGLSSSEVIFYSEYGDFYSLMPDWKEFEELKEKHNKSRNVEQH